MVYRETELSREDLFNAINRLIALREEMAESSSYREDIIDTIDLVGCILGNCVKYIPIPEK